MTWHIKYVMCDGDATETIRLRTSFPTLKTAQSYLVKRDWVKAPCDSSARSRAFRLDVPTGHPAWVSMAYITRGSEV